MNSREKFENWIFINSNWIIPQAKKLVRNLDKFKPSEKTYDELRVGDIFIMPYTINDFWLKRGRIRMRIILILDLYEEDWVGNEMIAHYYNWVIETTPGVGVAFEETTPNYRYGDRAEMNYKYVKSDKYSITHINSIFQQDKAQDVLDYVLDLTEGRIIITNINKKINSFLNWDLDEPWNEK